MISCSIGLLSAPVSGGPWDASYRVKTDAPPQEEMPEPHSFALDACRKTIQNRTSVMARAAPPEPQPAR